jgi:transcriptional regulator GlxA family with amidase domain
MSRFCRFSGVSSMNKVLSFSREKARQERNGNGRTIAFIGFNGVRTLDLTGPLEAFAAARSVAADGEIECDYELVVVGVGGKNFVSQSGVIFTGRQTIQSVREFDTIIVPGGTRLQEGGTMTALSAWLKAQAPRTRRIASVCGGIYPLAQSGLLDGRQVTTHWRIAADVARLFPRLRLVPNAIFIKDGPFYTSAGVTAGMDLSLALIEEDYGPKLAFAVARELVMYIKRSGEQEQYSEPLRFQTQSTDRFSDIVAWIAAHLHENLSVDILAERACCSVRHFSRLFKAVFGNTPADFVEELRLAEARHRLAAPRNSLESVGSSLGFHSVDAFSRAFERRFGMRPHIYRRRFYPLGTKRSSGKRAA